MTYVEKYFQFKYLVAVFFGVLLAIFYITAIIIGVVQDIKRNADKKEKE